MSNLWLALSIRLFALRNCSQNVVTLPFRVNPPGINFCVCCRYRSDFSLPLRHLFALRFLKITLIGLRKLYLLLFY